MADRYQKRALPAGDGYDRGASSRGPGNAESDPLAELARLIGQTDPFGARPMSRANLPMQPLARSSDAAPAQDDYQDGDQDGYQDSYYADSEPEEVPPPAPPSWMQRAATRQEAPPPPAPQDDYPNAVHPLHRYAAAHPPAEPDYDHGQYDRGPYDRGQAFAEPGQEPDHSRYDEALYGSFDSGAQHTQHDQGYAEDAYGYEDDERYDEQPEPKRRSGMITVAAVLALAVFGVGGAFAYRTYTGRVRSGEPPIIRADTGPTKIIPAPSDVTAKVPDRMAISDGTEKIVSREETPIDPGSVRPGPRIVFPPLTQNGSAPLPASIVPGGAAAVAGAPNGTFTNNEPHQVRTVTVHQDTAGSGTPAGAAPPAAVPPARPASRTAAASPRPSAGNPNAANANSPLSLAPQSEASAAPEPQVRMAATNPVQMVPSTPGPASAGGGGYLVQVSSQSSEAEAHASYRMLQSKYPSVLGSHAPVIRRAELSGEKVVYRAMVGPFSSSAEASQFCGSLKSAGGQCLIHRN